jgi:GcrA cell cycle regulator
MWKSFLAAKIFPKLRNMLPLRQPPFGNLVLCAKEFGTRMGYGAIIGRGTNLWRGGASAISGRRCVVCNRWCVRRGDACGPDAYRRVRSGEAWCFCWFGAPAHRRCLRTRRRGIPLAWRPSEAAKEEGGVMQQDADAPIAVADYGQPTDTSPGVPIFAVEQHHCRWPISPDGVPVSEFLFCGRQVAPGKMWCPQHCTIGHWKPDPTRRRARAQPWRGGD